MSPLLLELDLDRMPLPPLLLMNGVQPQLQVLQVSHYCCSHNAYLPMPAPVSFFNPFSAACFLSAGLHHYLLHTVLLVCDGVMLQLILTSVVQMDGMQLPLLLLSRLSLPALISLVLSTRCSAERSGVLLTS